MKCENCYSSNLRGKLEVGKCEACGKTTVAYGLEPKYCKPCSIKLDKCSCCGGSLKVKPILFTSRLELLHNNF